MMYNLFGFVEFKKKKYIIFVFTQNSLLPLTFDFSVVTGYYKTKKLHILVPYKITFLMVYISTIFS